MVIRVKQRANDSRRSSMPEGSKFRIIAPRQTAIYSDHQLRRHVLRRHLQTRGRHMTWIRKFLTTVSLRANGRS